MIDSFYRYALSVVYIAAKSTRRSQILLALFPVVTLTSILVEKFTGPESFYSELPNTVYLLCCSLAWFAIQVIRHGRSPMPSIWLVILALLGQASAIWPIDTLQFTLMKSTFDPFSLWIIPIAAAAWYLCKSLVDAFGGINSGEERVVEGS